MIPSFLFLYPKYRTEPCRKSRIQNCIGIFATKLGRGTMKKFICIGMAIWMSGFPKFALATAVEQMIPTVTVVEELSRAEAQKKVEDIVGSAEVRAKLESLGVSPEAFSTRLASLSDSELRQMASQMEAARYGGDTVVGVLLIVLLVLVIVYLARRI